VNSRLTLRNHVRPVGRVVKLPGRAMLKGKAPPFARRGI